MKNVLNKLHQAKAAIKAESLKKGGKNDFSKYNYFTPEQVEAIVFETCNNLNLVTKFDLKRNELGVTGYLTVTDLDSNEAVVFEMATAIPEIKATNIAQQLGGCVTYTERYLKQTAFGIAENQLDFDTTENTKRRSEPETNSKVDLKAKDYYKQNAKTATTNDDAKPWLNLTFKDGKYTAMFDKLKARIAKGEVITIEKLKEHFKIATKDLVILETELGIGNATPIEAEKPSNDLPF